MLKTKDLKKSYGKLAVLKGVDLAVKQGEIKGLIGMNGVGKTTLIECVCGVKETDGGSILIDGKDVSDKKARREVKKIIGYMPQSFGMFNDLTVEENLGYLAAVYDLSDDCISEVMARCGLTEQAKVVAAKLSGGYRQLLSLACAIIHKPRFMILDEPTGAMDPIFRKNFWEIVRDCRAEGATVLFITHFYEELDVCDTFACLADGKIVYDGQPPEIFGDRNKEVWSNLLKRISAGGGL